jgi:ribosomal protein L37E
MKQIEALGETHRDADEAFHRHKKFCTACAETPVAVLRYAAAE